MAAAATFTSPSGAPAETAIHAELHALTNISAGDLLYCGQIFRSRIRQRTFAGIDVNGTPFEPYSTNGPFYLYPNRDSAGGNRQARATAAKNRHAKTGRIGIRTPTGIKYESYSAAKAAHGSVGVNLYGMEQHTHMLDTMLVRVGGYESSAADDDLATGEMSAFEANTAATDLNIGFYGPEAERAKGNNEGTSRIPKREFFALNQQDLQLGERAIAERMTIRAQAGRLGASSGSPSGALPGGEITLDDVGF